MDKSKIFIASSGRTLVLAEMLRNELSSEFCEATLWSEEGRRQPGQVIIEMLESAADRYDFAVIILSKDDVMSGGKGETLKARDNCVFEAGLFMAAIGRRRCFLVNSVNQSDLPSDLNGIISIPFEEPADLSNLSECAQKIRRVATQLKQVVQQGGPSAHHSRLPLLSVDELFRLERPRSDGGDLEDGQVVVLDTQPKPQGEFGKTSTIT
jgi:predicted nucleotide-binding protein